MSTATDIEVGRKDGLRFAGVALAVNATMAVFKIIVGVLSGSHALLANALYSINDVLSAIAVAVSLRVGHRRPTAEYPYGFGKAEFVAIGMVSLTIAIGVIMMFLFSVADIIQGVTGPPHFLAMTLAGVSLVISGVLSRRGHRLAVALRSPVLATCAEHHHADALGSIATIIGVGAAVAGFHAIDRVIAVGETLHLIALSGTLLAKSVKGLMDVAVAPEDLDLMEEKCLGVDGVQDVSYVRSRRIGSMAWIDVGVAVDAELDVEGAEEISERVREAVGSTLGGSVITQVRTHGPAHIVPHVAAGGSGHG